MIGTTARQFLLVVKGPRVRRNPRPKHARKTATDTYQVIILLNFCGQLIDSHVHVAPLSDAGQLGYTKAFFRTSGCLEVESDLGRNANC
jgi:hypothetical protein